MSTENEKQQDEKLLNLVPNLLSGLKSIDANRYEEIFNFFKTAYCELSDHELFDDVTYRTQWQNNLCVIENASIPFIGYTQEEMRLAIDIAEAVLLKNRKKQLSA
ncbi:MAG: hypothetical protein K2P85_00145 [Flavobacteriaceae bacterium]|nr:hypothetical protein [Flavobacteriaceae bacterium]